MAIFKSQSERDIAELNKRYAYEVRNKGVNKAVDGMFERNAVRRESEARTAQRTMRDSIHEIAGKNLRKLYRDKLT